MTADLGHAPGAGTHVRTSAWSRVYGLGSVYAKTLRDSRLAVIIMAGLAGGFLLSGGAAFGEAYSTVASRADLANLVNSLPPAMTGIYGTPFPSHIETLGGSIAWKTGGSIGLTAAIWSILALSGTLAGETRRGSMDLVAVTPLGLRRIALEKLAAHLTGMAIVVAVVALSCWLAGAAFNTLPGDEIPRGSRGRLRAVGGPRGARLRRGRVRPGAVRRARRRCRDRRRRAGRRLLRERLPGLGPGVRAVRQPHLVRLDRPPPAVGGDLRLAVARADRGRRIRALRDRRRGLLTARRRDDQPHPMARVPGGDTGSRRSGESIARGAPPAGGLVGDRRRPLRVRPGRRRQVVRRGAREAVARYPEHLQEHLPEHRPDRRGSLPSAHLRRVRRSSWPASRRRRSSPAGHRTRTAAASR